MMSKICRGFNFVNGGGGGGGCYYLVLFILGR